MGGMDPVVPPRDGRGRGHEQAVKGGPAGGGPAASTLDCRSVCAGGAMVPRASRWLAGRGRPLPDPRLEHPSVHRPDGQDGQDEADRGQAAGEYAPTLVGWLVRPLVGHQAGSTQTGRGVRGALRSTRSWRRPSTGTYPQVGQLACHQAPAGCRIGPGCLRPTWRRPGGTMMGDCCCVTATSVASAPGRCSAAGAFSVTAGLAWFVSYG